jgi:hypothetical protein
MRTHGRRNGQNREDGRHANHLAIRETTGASAHLLILSITVHVLQCVTLTSMRFAALSGAAHLMRLI